MIKTEFLSCDFCIGDRIVLVNDELEEGDTSERLVPGVEGEVVDMYSERVAIRWDLPDPSYLVFWWVNASDIQPAASFVSVDTSSLL